MLTVGLPNYANDIAWLAMESLCRQVCTCEWELIIYEDSDKPLGNEFFSSYSERLKAVGCTRQVYINIPGRISLSRKWTEIWSIANKDSLGLMLQASDCYSEPRRIQKTFDALNTGCDWVQSPQGMFYHVKTGKTMMFTQNGETGLNMAIAGKHLDNIEVKDLYSGVDYWLFSSIKNPEIFNDFSVDWANGIDTDGYNRISLTRAKMYKNPKPPFCITHSSINSTGLPVEIIYRLTELIEE